MSSEVSSGVLAILGYHKIGPPPASGPGSCVVRPRGDLRRPSALPVRDWLAGHRPAAFLRGLAAPQTLPRQAALLTFDDGYRSNLTVAVPWLQRFCFPAVLFVPTDFIGRRNTFDANVEPEEEICTWDDLREMEGAGVAVQSHGCSHRTLSDLGLHEREREIVRSPGRAGGGVGTLRRGLLLSVWRRWPKPGGDPASPDHGWLPSRLPVWRRGERYPAGRRLPLAALGDGAGHRSACGLGSLFAGR